jgi:dihydroorotate dehydrogenase (fumarate)
MNLRTTYLGFELPHPFICGASPLTHDLDSVRRLEDAGAAAIVMHSLFQEQIEREATGTLQAVEATAGVSPEATSYFPQAHEFKLGPELYLEHIRRIKQKVKIPIIASLNGTTPAGWLEYARLIQSAGADALELNFYYLSTDPKENGTDVEKRLVSCVRMVKQTVSIPVAVKLTPFYSSLTNFATEIDQAGAKGLVLFNRVYQPEIDAELLNVVAQLQLSSSSELPLRLRWLGILYGRIHADLAITGGVHTALDAVKAVMAGASAVQMVSALLKNGPQYIGHVRQGLEAWMAEHQYNSLEEMRGSLSLKFCPDPAGYERANYARVLQSWRG